MKNSFILIGACFVFLASACSSVKSENSSKDKYPVISPIVMDTVYTNEYVANIQSRQNVEIRAMIKGFIEKIHVDEGKTVKQGQLLFTITNKGFQQDLVKAKATLANAIAEAKSIEVDLQNTQLLVEKNVVSKTELTIAQSKLDAANAKVEEAKSDEANALLNIAYTKITAPFDGIINRIPNKTGSLIDEGTLLTSISDNKEVFAYFKISEKEYLDFILKTDSDKNNGVELVLANQKAYKHKGIVETIEGEFEKSTGNISFRARFPNPEMILKHGSSGKVKLRTEMKNAMMIPQKSTFEIQEQTFVFVIDKNNTVQVKNIIPIVRLPHLYIIESSLAPTDKIIYEGIQRVKEGDTIVPEIISAKDILSSQTK